VVRKQKRKKNELKFLPSTIVVGMSLLAIVFAAAGVAVQVLEAKWLRILTVFCRFKIVSL
jgi:hypothetical protein